MCMIKKTATVLTLLFGIALSGTGFAGDENMSYQEAKKFLEQYTKVIELKNEHGGLIAVTPELQGRVMTSACEGENGTSFGFINVPHFKSGKIDLHFNNYGGEDRFWLSPEGGDFSLYFAPGAAQNLDNWYTPKDFNAEPFEVVSKASDPFVEMKRPMQLKNASGTEFSLDVKRRVQMLNDDRVKEIFGNEVTTILKEQKLPFVGYESLNTITNTGKPMSKKDGLVSIWILSMYNAAPKTCIIVPHKQGTEEKLGPIVKSDYFGPVPGDRLKTTVPGAVLFRADGHYRSKIGISQKRALPVLGSIDFADGVLTVVRYNMPKDPTACDYMNNMWGTPTEKPYQGDVVNCYNDGPSGPDGKQMGMMYEIESLSPAKELKTGESIMHQHSTLHIKADKETLVKLAKLLFGVDYDQVRKEMF